MHVSNVSVDVHASHQLTISVPKGHPCGRLHGHTYRISVEMSYSNDPKKLLMDFGVVKGVIKDLYDHRHLNDVMKEEPTAENLAKDIYENLLLALAAEVSIRSITVAETDNNVTTYVPDETEFDIEDAGEE